MARATTPGNDVYRDVAPTDTSSLEVVHDGVGALATTVVTLLLAVSGCGREGAAPGSASPFDGPVITPGEPWEAYPVAEVGGELVLRDGCLLLGDEIVFWPHGTTFDESGGAVVFPDGPPALVGASFTGGGGHYPADTDFTAWLGDETGEAITRCQQSTGVSEVVFAYPA